MAPTQSTAGKGDKSVGSDQGGTLAANAKKNRPTNQQDHVTQGEMKSMAVDIKLLISEKESMRGVVRVLEGDVETLKKQVEELKKTKSKEDPPAIDDVKPIKFDDHQPYEVDHAKSSAFMKDAAKNYETNIKKESNLIKYWRAVGGWASTRKIVVGFISIALLASIDPRQGSIGKSSLLLWKQKGSHSITPENINKAGFWGDEVLAPKNINRAVNSAPQNEKWSRLFENTQNIDLSVESAGGRHAKVSLLIKKITRGFMQTRELVESPIPKNTNKMHNSIIASEDEGTPIMNPDGAFSDVTPTAKADDASHLPERRGRDASLRSRSKRLQKAARPSKMTTVEEGVPPAEIMIQHVAGIETSSRTLQANSLPTAMASDESDSSPTSSNLSGSPVASTSPSSPDLRENNDEMAPSALSTTTIRPSIPSDVTPSQSSTGPTSMEVPSSQRSTRPSALSLGPSLSTITASQPTILEANWLERNALIQIYESAIGDKWQNRYGWLNPDISHCFWYGVYCDAMGTVLGLNLRGNQLSGELSKEIAGLKSLRSLDLGENNIEGYIPAEIGHLTDLEYIRLCYNGFSGTVPTEMGNLHQLELLQLHGNALYGAITDITIAGLHSHNAKSFVADCLGNQLDCDDCTLCCNFQGECEDSGHWGSVEVIVVVILFFVSIGFFPSIIMFVIFAHNKWKKHNLPRNEIDHSSLSHEINQSLLIEREYVYASEIIGTDSVYRFFIGNSLWGWAFALTTVGVQIFVLIPFIQEAEYQEEYMCAPGYDECVSSADADSVQHSFGITVFFFVMVVHLSKDIINGIKLIMLSCRSRNQCLTKLGYFVGGMCLTGVASYTFYISFLFNLTTATSNTDWIINSVVILFVTEVDERFFNLLGAINKHWVEITPLITSCETGEDGNQNHGDDDDGSQVDSQSGASRDPEGENQSLRQEVQLLSEVQQQNELLSDQNAKLKRLLDLRQEEDILSSSGVVGFSERCSF